jgi:SNF2 family DNA or RNA helicase
MQLRPYQMQTIDEIIGALRLNVFLPMGGGKTVSVLTALDMLSLCEDVFPALVVAPLRVARSTWPDEIQKWAHLRHLTVSVISVEGTWNRKKALETPADIYTINFDNLIWLRETLDGKWPFKTLVVDEATKLKGLRTRQGAKRAAALAKNAHRSGRYINLTGTPGSNGLKDLWGMNWFIDRGDRLGKTYTAFSDRWFHTVPTAGGYSMLKPHAHAQVEIQDRIKDVSVSIDLSQHLDMKLPVFNDIEVTLPAKARRVYDDMWRELVAEVRKGKEITAANAAIKSSKCLQIASGAIYLDGDEAKWQEVHTAKIEALDSVIEEAAGNPVLVAYKWKHDLARMKKAFPKGRVLDANPKTIHQWNAGDIQVLFAHPASAGHGISLQDGGHRLAFFSLDWNLEEHIQIIERIGPARQAQAGHDRPVFIHRILAKDTLDYVVLERLKGKRDVVDLLMEATRR